MSIPFTSSVVRPAIERLWPELSELLGINHWEFMLELDSLLQEGSDYQLLDLFDRSPAARQRLLEVIAQLGLYGHPGQFRSRIYRCERGPHCVRDVEVVQRDDDLRALCPRHSVIIIPVDSCG